MTIENQNEAGVPAPESTSTASVETVENPTPETQEPETPKTFTQEELDQIVAKEKAKVERKLKRDLAQAAQQPQQQAPADAPRPDQFRTAEEYVEALSDWKAEQKVIQRQAEQQRTQVESTYEERVEAARDKYDDFDDVVKNPNLTITHEMAAAIKESDLGPEIAYHLGTNPKEAARIANLSPVGQIREIGKIEASLSSNPPVAKKVSSAPEPIKPVGSRAPAPKYDPSDPRSASTMSTSEWIKARNEQIAKQSR